MMRMEIEECYSKGIMTDKKRYCIRLRDGSIKKVDISLSRKDVSGLCRAAAETAIEALFMDGRMKLPRAVKPEEEIESLGLSAFMGVVLKGKPWEMGPWMGINE